MEKLIVSEYWTRDLGVEAVLKEWGIQFTLEEINIDEINVAESHANQARPMPIIAEVQDSYCHAMRRGDKFPAIVGYRSAKGMILYGGNHRVDSAKEIGRETINCYVCPEPSDERIKRGLPYALNLIEGVRPQHRSCIVQAAAWVNDYGYSAKDAATAFCVSDSAVLQYVRASKVRERLASKNRKPQLPETSLSYLHGIQNDNILTRLHSLSAKAKLSGEEIRGAVKALKVKRTELEQLEKIGELATKYGCTEDGDLPPRAVRNQGVDTRARAVRRAITQLENCIDGKRTLAQLGFTTKTAKVEIEERIEEVCKQLQRIIRRR